MGVNEDDLNNIMGGMEAGGIKVNDQKRKLKNRFEICRKLGQGTYGKVQLGINKETGQQVAIKTIKKSKIETEADLIRIRREIQIMSSVQHPNIIHIYEVFENKEKMVLVMEIAAGGELYDYLSERKCLEENEARRVFRQIACAVYYCHKNNICHRDLKLENILLDENGNAKIADFGLSNVYDGNNLLNTFCGSPLYASPEIVRGNPYAGPEVDCWSLGVLLYTLVYGAMPFDGSNFKRLVKQITTGDYYEPKSPSPASGLVRAMLTVSNEKRANIGDICSHWWVNEGYPQPCLDEAEYLASLTPVRLDLLLSLAPSAREEIIPGQDAQVPATPSLPPEEVSIEELPSIPPPIVETIAPPSLPPLSEPVAAPVVAPLAASEPAVIDVKAQEPVEVKKREKEKGKRKLSETPSMVDPDLVTKKPSGRKSTTPVPTTPPPIPMETNDNAVYERQVSPHRSGRSTPKANRKRREGAKTPVSETNNDQNNQPPLVPEMTPEIQRKPPAPKAKSKGEDEAEVAKPMKRRLSRKERNVKTPDPNFEGGDHTKHIPAERPMTPRQARAPSPEERPLVVPLPPPRVQDIPLPPVRGESLERPHQIKLPPPPRNESLERPPKSPVTPKSPSLLAEPVDHNDKPPMIPPHATEQVHVQPSTEVKEPASNQVSINEKLPTLPPRPAPVQTQEPEVIDNTSAPPPPPRSLPPERTQEEIDCKKREIEAKKKQMAEALKVLKQLESTVTPDKIDVINYDQPVDEVQPLEIALPSLAQAKEGVRNSGLFNSVIQVNVPPVTAVQPEVKKPELIEVKNLPVASKKEATPSPSTSLIRQEQAQDLNEGHQAKQPLKKEVIDNQINERADSSKQIERIAHEGQGQQKVGSLPVQDSEQEKRPKPSETMSQGKAADNQMNLFSAKQELASQKTTNDVMYPVSAEVDKSLPDVNGTASKTDENRALINSLPKPFQANNIPNDEEPVSENSREISRVEKAQEPLHIETQPTPSIHQLSLDHTPESTLPSPQSVPVTPPSSDSPQNVPKYHLLQRPEKRDNRDSKVIKAAAYWNTYIGEVLDKKKPIPDNVKSLEKPKKIVTAGVGPKGYNDLKTAFESKTSTPKQEEPSINVSPSSTAVGGMQRRNSRKIPIEGCSPGLKVTDAKSVFETKHQQPQTPVVYRRNSSSTGDSIGKGKESDEFQTRGPNYVKKKVPEFPPPPIAKTPFGSNRRAGALSPQTIQPKDEKLSLQNGVPEDESKSKPKSVARTADSLLKETSEQKPEVKTVDQNGKTSSLHNTTTAAVNERLQPKPSESQNGVKKDEQLSEQKAKSVKSFVSPKQEPVSSTKPSPKPVSNDVIPSSTSTVPAFVDNKHSSKIRTVNEAPSIPVKPVIDIKSKHIAKAMPSTDTNGTVKEVIKVKCDVAENDKVSGPKKVESVKKQLPEKPTAVSKDEGQSKPSKNEPKISAPVEQELPKPVPKSSEDKQLRNEVKAAENVGNHRIIPIQIQQSPAEARVPVQNASNSDLKIPIQTESTSEMKIPIHTLKSEDSHKAESRPEATKIPIQTEPISSRVPIQIESNETFSRQESVRSPVSQEHHIPIHVEGKGTILNKVSSTASGLDGDSLEGRDNFSTNSLSRRRFGSRKKRSSYAYSDSSNSSNLGAVEPSQEEVYDASSGGLQKYTSIGKHGIEPMFRLRKTRPPFAAQRSDSFSSGEEEFEDEYFRETTAENLFSTLLTRVKSLTRRINDEDDQLRHQNHKIINHRLNPGGTHGFLERTALRSSLKRTPSSTQSALSRQSSMDTSGMRASFRDDPSYEVGGYDDGTSSVRSYGSSAMDRDVGGYGRSSIHRGTTIKDDQIDGSLYKGGGVSMKGKHEQQEQNKRFGLEQNAVKKADSEDLSSSVSVTSKQRLRPGYLPPPSHLASESNSDLANFDTRIENALSESSSVKSMPNALPLKRVPITVERGLSSASLASGPSQSDMLETMSEQRTRKANNDNSKRHSRVMFHLHEANEPPKEQPSSQPVWIKKENVGDESPTAAAATQVKSPYKFVQIKRLSAGLDLDDDRSLASTSSGYVSQPQHHHLPAKVEGSRLRSYNNQEGQLQTNKPLTLEKESSKPSTISTASFTASNSSSVASNINVGPSNPMPEPMPISVASSVQDSMSKLPSPPVNLPTQLSVPISKPKPTIKSPPKLYLPRVTQSPPRVSSPPVPVTQVSSPAPKTAPPTQPMTIPPFSQIQSVPQKSQLSSPPPKSTPPQYAPPSLPSDEPIPESVIKPVASSQHDSAPKVKSPVLTQPLYTPFRRSSISEGDSNSATSPPGSRASTTQQPSSMRSYNPSSSSRKGTAMEHYRKISSETKMAEEDLINKLRREAAERARDLEELTNGYVSPLDPEFFNDDSTTSYSDHSRVRKKSSGYLGRLEESDSEAGSRRYNYDSESSRNQPISRHVTRRSVSRELHDYSPSSYINNPIDFSRSSRERSLGRDLEPIMDVERRLSNRRSESLSRPTLASQGRSLTQSELGSSSLMSRRLSSGLRSPVNLPGDDDYSSTSSATRSKLLEDRTRGDWRRVSVPERGKDFKSLSKKYNRYSSVIEDPGTSSYVATITSSSNKVNPQYLYKPYRSNSQNRVLSPTFNFESSYSKKKNNLPERNYRHSSLGYEPTPSSSSTSLRLDNFVTLRRDRSKRSSPGPTSPMVLSPSASTRQFLPNSREGSVTPRYSHSLSNASLVCDPQSSTTTSAD